MCQHELREHPHAPDAGRRLVFGEIAGSSAVTLGDSFERTSARALTDISLSSCQQFYWTSSPMRVSFCSNLHVSVTFYTRVA